MLTVYDITTTVVSIVPSELLCSVLLSHAFQNGSASDAADGYGTTFQFARIVCPCVTHCSRNTFGTQTMT